MIKRILKVLTLIIILSPIITFADSIKISCGSTKIEPNKTTNCTVTGTTSSDVSSLSAKLSSSGSIKISNIKTDKIWQGDGEGGSIELYTDTNKKGTFNIATFTVTGSSEGTGSVTVNNVTFYDGNFSDIAVSNSALNITVAKAQSSTPTPSKPSTGGNSGSSTTVKSGDATLKSLTITPGTLNFSKNVTSYTVNVNSNVNSVSIKAVANDSTSTVSIPKNLNLTGDNTKFSIVVTAKDKTTKTYTINVVKAKKVEPVYSANIKTMSIEGISDFKFDSSQTEYTVNTDSSKLNISVVLEDMTAEYNIYGNNNLKNNDTILVQVKAQDGSVKEYKIKVVKTNTVTESNKTVESTNNSFTIPTYIFVIAELLWVILLILYIRLLFR